MLLYPIEKLLNLRSQTFDGVVAIYLNTALRKLALSLTGTFLPVFIFFKTQSIFGFGIQIGLYGVIVYSLILNLFVLFFSIPFAQFLAKYGFRWTFATSNLFLISLLALLTLSEINIIALPIAAAFHGISRISYWLSYHTLFAEDGVITKLGEEFSLSRVIESLAGLAGPALGGLIITIWGFQILFLITLGIVVWSGLPFFFMHYHERRLKVDIRQVFSWLRRKDHRNEEFGLVGRYAEDTISLLFWPVYMFLIVGSYQRLGLIMTLSLVAGTMSVFLAGKMFDRIKIKNVFRFGAIATSIIWLFRGTVRSFSKLVITETSMGLLSPYYWVSFDSMVYERSKGKGEDVLTFMVARMFILSLQTLVVLGIVAVIVPFVWRFWGMWIIAALGAILSTVIWEKRRRVTS
jgi:hypothetical protein